jgi:subtilisin family serine protease
MSQASQSELIVVLERAAAPGFESFKSDELPTSLPEVGMLAERVAEIGAVMRRGFRRQSARLREHRPTDLLPALEKDESPAPIHDLSTFFRVEAEEEERLQELAHKLRNSPGVISAYVQPRTELPEAENPDAINNMRPSPSPPPSATPDFTDSQVYLNAAPDGINAAHAWAQPGGTGRGVRIIDIEWAWNVTHENLLDHDAPIYGGAPRYPSVEEGKKGRNHGTAVLGVTSATHSGFGVKGICPEATVRTITNIGGLGTGEVIQMAADMLEPGDILILEMHRPGPRFNFTAPQGQRGLIAVEWWFYDLVAIQDAVSRGIIVVEAAGNGSENLDATLYDSNPLGFPAPWRNPFRRNPVDSGAIIVGAGAPPPGTHGRDHGPARSRLDFSNFGSPVDAQGWGREVTSCGYGDLQGGIIQEDLWYTDRFSGTSSATPIVAGALACVQGIRKANGLAPCTPAQMRSLLRQNTGSAQQDGPIDPNTGNVIRPRTERIGMLPDLRLLITEALNLT